MQKLSRVGILSVAKVMAGMYAVVGLVIGVIVAIMAFLGMLVSPVSPGGGAMIFPIFGVLSIILFPIIYGILGFIGGAICAFLYNLVAGWIGGIEVELK